MVQAATTDDRSLSERYPRIYKMLKRTRFSPAKAVEVLFDAKRKQNNALLWIKTLKRWGCHKH